MLLESVSKGSSDESALIRVMAWRRISDNQNPKITLYKIPNDPETMFINSSMTTTNIVFDFYLNVWRFYLRLYSISI